MLNKTIDFLSFRKKPSYTFSRSNVLSHACASPLTILMSNLEEELIGSKKNVVNDRLSSSIEAVKKLSQIIKSVVGDQNSNEKFQVKSAINEVICLLKCQRKNFIIDKILVDSNLLLFGNKLYFQEALTCILNNSLEAYEISGKKPISLVVRKISDKIRIDVVDFASGMNLVIQKLVLLNGISTKKDGAGLGLHFAKKTIEEIFSGRMTMKSAIGFGTHITWTIPLA